MMISRMYGKYQSRPPTRTEEGATMPRPKKDAKPLNIKLDSAIHTKLERFCNETGMNKTVTVEKILDQYLNSYFSGDSAKSHMK